MNGSMVLQCCWLARLFSFLFSSDCGKQDRTGYIKSAFGVGLLLSFSAFSGCALTGALAYTASIPFGSLPESEHKNRDNRESLSKRRQVYRMSEKSTE